MMRDADAMTTPEVPGGDPPNTAAAAATREPVHVVRLPGDIPHKIERYRRFREREEDVLEDILMAVAGPSHLRRHAANAVRPRYRQPKAASVPTPSWIASLETWIRPDGSLAVKIGRCRFVLPPYLGALLLALADSAGEPRDGGVPFKTLADLAVQVAKRTGGRAPSHATLNKYIHRLRQILVRRAGLTGDAIQSHRQFGRRLAIRR